MTFFSIFPTHPSPFILTCIFGMTPKVDLSGAQLIAVTVSVLTTTSEQRPPVYKGQLDPQFFKIENNL
jgi:hypothetical protein